MVDTGSIAEAARAEGLTAAAVGQRIQALERQLGVSLLSRARHTARPTEACLNLVPRARHIVREAARLAADIDPGGVRGTLRVGAISTALTGLMPATLRRLTADAPGIKPVIVPGTSRELYEAVADGSLDAALLAAPPFGLPRTLTARTLQQEPLMLVTPLQGPYRLDGERGRQQSGADGQEDSRTPTRGGPARHEAIASILQSLPYIRYDPQAWGGRHAARWLEDAGIAPPIVCDLDALETIVMLVSDGVGFSLLPGWHGIERLAHGCRLTSLTTIAQTGALPDIDRPENRIDARHRRDADDDAHRYARPIILLQAAQPDRPGMLAALARALSIDGPADLIAPAAPRDDRSGS